MNANRTIRELSTTSTQSDYIEEHGENSAVIMHSLWGKKILGEDRTFGEIFNEWTKKILNTRFEVRMENSTPRIVAMENDYVFELEQIGYGNMQIIPLIIMVLSSTKGDLLLIETPEEQLHPKWRANLVEFFYFAAQKGIKLVVETHSVEVINRMRVLLKSDKRLHEYTSLYFLEKQGFETVAQKINIEDTGKLSFWPEDFLDKVTIEDSFKLLRP